MGYLKRIQLLASFVEGACFVSFLTSILVELISRAQIVLVLIKEPYRGASLPPVSFLVEFRNLFDVDHF